MAGDPITNCLRYSTTSYDGDYAQLPTSESIATHLDASQTNGFRMLTTSATWERGLGAMLSATDPNNATTAIGYDGLGRKVNLDAPDGIDCVTQL